MKYHLTFKQFIEKSLNEAINKENQFPSIKNTDTIEELRNKWLKEMEEFDKLFDDYDNLYK